MKKHLIYLDFAAATPLSDVVRAAMEPYFSDKFYNPSALYLASKEVAKDTLQARSLVAHWLGARPAEIVFTAGGTEANNLAIHGIMQQYPTANVVVSAIEHESVLQPAAQYDVRRAGVQADGRLNLDKLEQLIDDQTVLVSIMYANNEIGTVQPLKQVAQLVSKIREDRRVRGSRLPIYLHSDGCQAANYLDLQTSRLGVDLMTLNGGKIYGPKQSGALFVKANVPLQSLINGGGQERGLRSGTENVAGVVGFAAALDTAQTMRREESARLTGLQKKFLEFTKAKLPSRVVNGSVKWRLPNNIHLTIPGKDNEMLLMQLDEQGIMCATGSACTASSQEPSHVLTSLGVSDKEAHSSLRFTMGRGTSLEDITRVVSSLSSLVN